uniref:Uncharacterized protein n=1 Tax=Caenorhabditis japonica TaxID=281687 RepID=A0A8R1EMJ6_CAEJA
MVFLPKITQYEHRKYSKMQKATRGLKVSKRLCVRVNSSAIRPLHRAAAFVCSLTGLNRTPLFIRPGQPSLPTGCPWRRSAWHGRSVDVDADTHRTPPLTSSTQVYRQEAGSQTPATTPGGLAKIKTVHARETEVRECSFYPLG